MKKFLLSLALVVGSQVVVAQEVKATETTLTGTVIRQTTEFVERTVNLIATPFLSDKDIECMAKNIFYEAGSEPTEGKIAVGIVTLNRTQDGRFGKSVCDVVKARTVVVKNQEIKKTEVVRVGYFGSAQEVEKKVVVAREVPVCQFSWTCGGYARKPKSDDERWVESQEIAQGIARGDYEEYRAKYGNALFFHATAVRPVWAKTKHFITKTGHHLFYE